MTDYERETNAKPGASLTFSRAASAAIVELSLALCCASAAAQSSPTLNEIHVDSADEMERISNRSEEQTQQIPEVLVTAEKRTSRLVDVPVSMTVVDDRTIQELGISDLQDLSLFSPNTNIDINPVLPDIRIRGFGSDPSNRAFDQSVGLVVDGVPYSRSQFFNSTLFDVESVEVLRGPQGTLFGKNTTVGAVLVQTQKPTRETTGHINLVAGSLDRREGEAAFSSSAFDDAVRFRVAGVDERISGFFRNTTADVSDSAPHGSGGRRRHGARGTLNFPDIDGVDLELSYEKFAAKFDGVGLEYDDESWPRSSEQRA